MFPKIYFPSFNAFLKIFCPLMLTFKCQAIKIILRKIYALNVWESHVHRTLYHNNDHVHLNCYHHNLCNNCWFGLVYSIIRLFTFWHIVFLFFVLMLWYFLSAFKYPKRKRTKTTTIDQHKNSHSGTNQRKNKYKTESSKFLFGFNQ